MKTKTLFFTIFSICLLGLSACKKDDPGPEGCSVAWATAVEDESQAVSAAITAFSNNPTTENCNAYKSALQSLIDAYRPFEDCSALTGDNRAQFEQALDQAEDSLSDLDCTEYNG